MMRFHEIIQPYPTPDAFPFAVVASIHPSIWSQMRKFIKASPDDYHLLDKIEPQSDNWVVHIGCASEAARNQFDAAWG